MTNTEKLLRDRLAAALRLGIGFMEGFEDDETQDTVTDDLKTMRDALADHEASPPSMYRVVWEIDLDAGHPREAAELALAIHRDPASIATFFSVTAPDGTVTHHDLEEGDSQRPAPALVLRAAPAMLEALRAVSVDYNGIPGTNRGSISLAALTMVRDAIQAAGA